MPSNSLSATASASRVARSRWLVGSSSSSRLGRCQTIMASTRRAFSPPLMVPTGCLTMSPLKLKLPRKPRRSCSPVRSLTGSAQLARHAHHVLQRGVLRAQHVQFLLREVADVQALAFGDGAGQRAHLARDGLHQRRLALAVGAQDADALAGQHRAVDAAQDGLGRLVLDRVAEAAHR